jgi:hypothetical protein
MSTKPHEEDEREGLLNQLLTSEAPSEDVDPGDCEQEAEDELLSQLNKEYESEDSVGDEIANSQLAKLVAKMFRSKMAVVRHGGCPPMAVVCKKKWIAMRDQPTVKLRNQHVSTQVFIVAWGNTQRNATQQVLIKGIVPVIKIADLCMSGDLSGDKAQQAKRLALESLSLLTHTNYELNIQRKLFMKPDIGKDYAALCSPQVAFTDCLFGDDLQKQLKDIGDENKIGTRVLPSHKSSYHGNADSFN